VRCAGIDELLETLPRAEIALVWRFRQEWFELAGALRWIVTPAAGRDYFQVRPPPGVEIGYGTFHGELIAETVLAMMLAQARGLPVCAGMRSASGGVEREWPRADLDRTARPLRGSRVVILGFGNIGDWVGRLAKPFGVRITGVRRQPAGRPAYFDDGDAMVPAERLDAVLPGADHLVLTLPGGAATHHIIDARRLSLLPAHAVVYNVGRGSAIDEAALVDALRRGAIAGAGLDVYETEPLPLDSPLRACPGVILLPHAAAISPNYLDLFIDEFVARYRTKYEKGG
jgi:phosphoglycerate dehydrogenase-like enzyme